MTAELGPQNFLLCVSHLIALTKAARITVKKKSAY